jgi:hypothetical protein
MRAHDVEEVKKKKANSLKLYQDPVMVWQKPVYRDLFICRGSCRRQQI